MHLLMTDGLALEELEQRDAAKLCIIMKGVAVVLQLGVFIKRSVPHSGGEPSKSVPCDTAPVSFEITCASPGGSSGAIGCLQ